jgi:predicted nucleic acid-binding Zn ribbon protein
MTDDPLTVCPQCGSEIHRVLYPAGIVFKGSGFYKTEYSSNGGSSKETAEHKAESGESKSTSESSKSTSESKKGESSAGGASSSSSAPTTTAAD